MMLLTEGMQVKLNENAASHMCCEALHNTENFLSMNKITVRRTRLLHN